MNKALIERGKKNHVIPCWNVNLNGFTLIELLISITILSIVLLALIPLLINITGIDRSVSIDIKARQIATQKIEEMKSWTVEDIQNCLGGNTSCSGNDGVIETAWGVKFNRTWSINQVQIASSSNPPPLAFTTVVQYTYKGQQKTKVFTSLWGY